MRFRTWPVAALGLGALLLLVMFSVWTASQKAQAIYTELAQLNDHHRDVDGKLRRLRSDIHLSGIFVRDYLLDTERAHAPEYRRRLSEFRASSLATLDELAAATRGASGTEERLDGLQGKLEDYWGALEPLFDWTPIEKQTLSGAFLKRQVIPRRDAVLSLAQQVEDLNNDNMLAQRSEIARRYAAFRHDLDTLLWRTLLLGIAVALVPVFRLRVLEKRSEQQRAMAHEAEGLMRHLSQRLVAAQEAERKELSRELHDHVGQQLTALRLELGRLDREHPQDLDVRRRVAECRQVVDNLVKGVRDLALGLRPSMLDDLGLEPALEWLVRDVGRRSALDISLTVRDSLDGLDDRHRTCVYRAVQEALTNCIRHSAARHVRIDIACAATLAIDISDDGVGFDPSERKLGLGLRGMSERVRELGGTLSIRSRPAEGTTLLIGLPVMARAQSDNAAARLAG